MGSSCPAGSGGGGLSTLGTNPAVPFWQFLQQRALTAGRGTEVGQLGSGGTEHLGAGPKAPSGPGKHVGGGGEHT